MTSRPDERAATASPSTAHDAGSASVWTLALAAVVWVSAASTLLAGEAVIARHRAASAADLAALAAAQVAVQVAAAGSMPSAGSGPAGRGSPAGSPSGEAEAPCTAAARIAAGNGAQLTTCAMSGQVVEVTVRVPTPLLRYLGVESASARARAGPG